MSDEDNPYFLMGAMLGEKSGEVTDLRRRVEELEAKLAQQDDLVQAAVAAALTEADEAVQSVASNCTTEDGHVAIIAAVEKVRSLITPDAQAVLNRVVAAKLREAAGALFKWGDIYGDNAALCVLALIPKEKSDA